MDEEGGVVPLLFLFQLFVELKRRGRRRYSLRPFVALPPLFFVKQKWKEEKGRWSPPPIACCRNGRRGGKSAHPLLLLLHIWKERGGVEWFDPPPSFLGCCWRQRREGRSAKVDLPFFPWSNDPEGICYVRKTQIEETIILGKFFIDLCPFWVVRINPLLNRNSIGSCYIVIEIVHAWEYGRERGFMGLQLCSYVGTWEHWLTASDPLVHGNSWGWRAMPTQAGQVAKLGQVVESSWVVESNWVTESGWAALGLTLQKMTILPLVHIQSSKGQIFLVGRPIPERSKASESLWQGERHFIGVVFFLRWIFHLNTPIL